MNPESEEREFDWEIRPWNSDDLGKEFSKFDGFEFCIWMDQWRGKPLVRLSNSSDCIESISFHTRKEIDLLISRLLTAREHLK